MSEREILGLLKKTEYREVVEACEISPKSAKEIAETVELTERECADVIETLENAKALEYISGRWKATPIAIDTLKKYFR